ncbi:unnamed protein product [Closterium sp. Naga37s-1]|nr:unnamed protein product [Closterium sp. Naga37s-1]
MSQTDCPHVLIPSLPPSLAMLSQPLEEARGSAGPGGVGRGGGGGGEGAPDTSNDEEIARLLQQELSLEEGGLSHLPAAPPVGSNNSSSSSGGVGSAGAGRAAGGGQQHPVWSALVPAVCKPYHAACLHAITPSHLVSSLLALLSPLHQFNIKDGKPYHAACHRQLFHPKCTVCQDFIRPNPAGMINFRSHPFWGDKWCPAHMTDSTPSCTSCSRLQSRGSPPFIDLPDGRHLCLDCVDSAVLDSADCRPLFSSVSAFFAQLGMPVRQQIPVLAVEQQALNDAQRAEREGHEHGSLTRGLCLSEEQTIQMVVRLPGSLTHASSFSAVGQQTMTVSRHCAVTAILVLYGLPSCAVVDGTCLSVAQQTMMVPHHCAVTAILVLDGLPSTPLPASSLHLPSSAPLPLPLPIRVLTASILAHELMHAWFKLDGTYAPSTAHAIPHRACHPPSRMPSPIAHAIPHRACHPPSRMPSPIAHAIPHRVCHPPSRMPSPIAHAIPHRAIQLEEGMCQVMAYLWLQTQAPPAPHAPSQAPSQQASSAAPLAHEAHSSFQQRFAAFCLHSIATDASPVYGDGFRAAHAAVLKHGLLPTLEHIRACRALPRV